MSDTVTVLTHSTNPMAKTWEADGTVTSYGKARHFRVKEYAVDDIQELSSLLGKLQDDPYSCIIRGSYKGEEYSAAQEPEHQPGKALRRMHLFDDNPHHWVLIEVDDFEPMTVDPVAEPLLAIEEYIQCHLPESFRHTSYHWQLSNSAGLPKYQGILKAHLWFWLDEPHNSATLKSWAASGSIHTDVSVFNPVQVHYTARPIFHGVSDPVPVRSGFVNRMNGHATLGDVEIVAAPTRTRQTALHEAHLADPVAQMLFDKGMVHQRGQKGELFITCPREAFHTGESGISSTAYFPANTGGYAQGHFKCLHAHCQDEPDSAFLEALGYTDMDLFEDLGPEPPMPVKLSEITGKPRFTPIPAGVFARSGSAVHWFVRGVMRTEGLAVVYGASGSGKTFMVLDLAMAIARGKTWRGRKTGKGRVVYVVAEGASGFRRRLTAYAKAHDLDIDQIDLLVIPDAPSLLDVKEVTELIAGIESLNAEVDLIVLDTLAQVTAGGNENSGEDMGKALRHAQIIGNHFKALVLLVHHSGKDETRGARGWSGIKGALETEIEIIRSGESRVMTITKQKDGEGEGDSYGFELEEIEIGVYEDEDGDLEKITSCVVRESDATRKSVIESRSSKGDEGQGKSARLILKTLRELTNETLGSEGWFSFRELYEKVKTVDPDAFDGRKLPRFDSFERSCMALYRKDLIDFDGAKCRLPVGDDLV